MASSSSHAQKIWPPHKRMLVKLPRVSPRETRAQCLTVKDNVWEAVDKLPATAPPPFEDIKEDENHHYVTLLSMMTLKEKVYWSPLNLS